METRSNRKIKKINTLTAIKTRDNKKPSPTPKRNQLQSPTIPKAKIRKDRQLPFRLKSTRRKAWTGLKNLI